MVGKVKKCRTKERDRFFKEGEGKERKVGEIVRFDDDERA